MTGVLQKLLSVLRGPWGGRDLGWLLQEAVTPPPPGESSQGTFPALFSAGRSGLRQEHQYQLGGGRMELSPAEKALGVLEGAALCSRSTESQLHPGGIRSSVASRAREGICSSALCWDTSPAALRPDGECSAQEGHGAVGARPEKGHKEDLRDRHGEMVSN